MHRPKTLSAFTLIELSIVLVILGLLVGGVLTGKSLIRSSGLRSVLKERDMFAQAIDTFHDRYNALPGDMPNGYTYWSTSGQPGCQLNKTNAFVGCNGNGNGLIDYATGENVRAWMHLSLSGLIPGSYPGTDASDGSYGVTTPAARLTPNTWDIVSHDASSQATDYLGIPGLWLILGTPHEDIFMEGTKVTNGEAWNMDSKIDDGRAGTGNMIGGWGDNGTDYYQIGTLGPNTVLDYAWIFFKID